MLRHQMGVGGRPANFITAPGIQPDGNSYSLIDYGLMEDFKVYALVKKSEALTTSVR